MSATKVAVKRKISDELPRESNIYSKKRKVEERKSLNKELAKAENISARKICQKLSSISNFEKKYKYYCKKHNVLYLIQNTRRKSREFSKKSRDALVNSFRSLDLTKDSAGAKQSFLGRMDDDLINYEMRLLNQPISSSIVQKNIISRIFVVTDENELEAHPSQCNESIPVNMPLVNKYTVSQLVHRFILCNESGDSDSDEEYQNEICDSSENENYTLTRSPKGNNVIMKKVKDSRYLNGNKNDCTHCDCLPKHYFKNRLKYYNSSFNNLYTG